MAQPDLEYAKEYARLLIKELERGHRSRAIEYVDQIHTLLLRGSGLDFRLGEIPAEAGDVLAA